LRAGFTTAETEGDSRSDGSMGNIQAQGLVSQFEEKLTKGMIAKGIHT